MPRTVHTAKASALPVITSLGVAVVALYFARDVLIPLALSILLAFLLAPLVTRLERARIGRIPAVLLVVAVAFALIFTIGWVVGKQIVSLADNVPLYHDNIVHKAEEVRGRGGSFGARFAKLGQMFEKGADGQSTTGGKETVSKAVGKLADGTAVPTTQPGTTSANPLYTVVVPSQNLSVKTFSEYSGLLLGPLGTGGLVIVFVIFMLLEREDLRDRLIRVVSRGRYTVTTRAINDAATRISRYMLAQSLVNGIYGLVIGTGLWIIGLTLGNGTGFPSFVLWGLLCAALRFIPYIGAWVAVTFPVLLSLAVYPGFEVFFVTVALLVTVELITNNAMEPWLYGASTGLSTVAILVAAVFWTWLWGPVGLLLSTPLTVCMVVLGKNVPRLKFLDILLGDQPALPPAVRFYQRLLAGDQNEANRLTVDVSHKRGSENVPDELLIPALLLARRDRRDEELTAENEAVIFDQIKPFISKTAAEPSAASGSRILGVCAHHRAEELIVEMLQEMMRADGIEVELTSTRTLVAEIEQKILHDPPAALFVAVLPPGGVVQARYLCRRLHKRFKDLRIVVGYFGRSRDFDQLLVNLRGAGASYVSTSLLQTRSQLKSLVVVTAQPTPVS